MATIGDGKWNYSIFTWYDYDLQISSFSKILDDKTIEDKGITEDLFSENELYLENTEENKTKYNKDEYTIGYLLLSGKKYYGYIKKTMLVLIGGDTPQQPYPTHTTIKEQTEKTEQLKTTLDSKVIAIADEIKKQDNIDITRLSEVPDAIAQLKNSRKRWATGESGFRKQDKDIYLSIRNMNLSFTPKYIIWLMHWGPFGSALNETPRALGGMVDKIHTRFSTQQTANTPIIYFEEVKGDELNVCTMNYYEMKKMHWIAFE